MRRALFFVPFGVALFALWTSAAPAPFPPPGVSQRVEDILGRQRVRLLLRVDRAELFERYQVTWRVTLREMVGDVAVKVGAVKLEKDFARKVARALLDERVYNTPPLANPSWPLYTVRLWSGRESVVLHFNSLVGSFDSQGGNLVDLSFCGPDGKVVSCNRRLGRFPGLGALLKGNEGKILQQRESLRPLVEEMQKQRDNGR
jgi:hypothetical protein